MEQEADEGFVPFVNFWDIVEGDLDFLMWRKPNEF
jgi:hypothetical protein